MHRLLTPGTVAMLAWMFGTNDRLQIALWNAIDHTRNPEFLWDIQKLIVLGPQYSTELDCNQFLEVLSGAYRKDDK